MWDFLEVFADLLNFGWRVILLVTLFMVLGYLIYDKPGLGVGLVSGIVIGLIWDFKARKK
jgi:cell shape-determining protein MreD